VAARSGGSAVVGLPGQQRDRSGHRLRGERNRDHPRVALRIGRGRGRDGNSAGGRRSTAGRRRPGAGAGARSGNRAVRAGGRRCAGRGYGPGHTVVLVGRDDAGDGARRGQAQHEDGYAGPARHRPDPGPPTSRRVFARLPRATGCGHARRFLWVIDGRRATVRPPLSSSPRRSPTATSGVASTAHWDGQDQRAAFPST
jgi:hypothetical protein